MQGHVPGRSVMPRPKAWIAWSSGKDSAWALHVARERAEVDVVGMLTTLNETQGRVSIHGVAVNFGGGGHPFASGARVRDTLKNVTKAVTEALAEKIRAHMGPDE